jgi:sterol desaturase/sphingolipid hydroxylase (fatty acid hydroxylase superfamily)
MTLEAFTWVALFGGFALTAVAEMVWPKYAWTPWQRGAHFLRNFLLWLIVAGVLSSASWVLFSPAQQAADVLQLGLLRTLHAPLWVAAIVGFVLADFSDYVFHRASHRFRVLWLLHSVHHSDPKLDASTSLRQHPLSYLSIVCMRVLLVMALGAPLWSLLLRDLCAILTSHLHHAAVAWSPRAIAWMERYVGWLIVPPTAHWLHHDPRESFTNSNYGQLLSCWDRLFGTYSPSTTPSLGSGLQALSEPKWHSLRGMLMTPWWARRLPKL